MSKLNLRFESKMVDTNLAKQYRADILDRFKKVGLTVNEDYRVVKESNIAQEIPYEKPLEKAIIPSESLQILANKIEENAELMAQIDYLARKKPIADTKTYDLKLITQYLRYCSGSTTTYVDDKNNYIITIGDNSSLTKLCLITKKLSDEENNSRYIISCGPKTAVIGYLFQCLCNQSGINWVQVQVDNKLADYCDSQQTALANAYCTGIVTERSDIDSAIDSIVYATSQSPWGFKHLYVQDSVFETFKKILSFKSSTTDSGRDDKLQSIQCEEAIVVSGKIFLINYIGDEKLKEDYILVEGFRTIKELLSMVESKPSFCVSLWCNDIAEVNFIALNIKSSLVWANTHGGIMPLDSASLCFYSSFYGDLNVNRTENNIHSQWLKLDIEKRLKITNTILEKYNLKPLQYRKPIKSVEIDINKMYISIETPAENVWYFNNNWDKKTQEVEQIQAYKVAQALVNGSMINITEKLPNIYSDLKKQGAPIFTKTTANTDTHLGNLCKTKVIISNFGSVFAN